MKIIYFLLLLILGSLSACSKQDIKRIEKDSKVVAIGDSLTFGYGGNGVNYPDELAKTIERRVVNSGVNGDTTQQVLHRIDKIIQEETPSFVILAIGGNDMLRGVGDDVIKENIYAIIDKLEKSDVTVIILAEPRPRTLGMIFNLSDASFYKEIAQNKKLFLINNVFSDLLSKDEYKSDLIHLNGRGYKKAAEQIANALIKQKIVVN